jgi:hypothetical protein
VVIYKALRFRCRKMNVLSLSGERMESMTKEDGTGDLESSDPLLVQWRIWA